MKKLDFNLLTLAIVFCINISGFTAWAQESSSSEFTLEEITVTAEKRAVSVQALPSSVVAIEGDALSEQGKATTAQIIEAIPNVTYRTGSGTNPDGNITIRGVQRTQESAGANSILPSVTAIYVDGVYQGLGGGYDVNRVEVLRGPQGTLYGRSATGGVIGFYTNDPKLGQVGVNASAEFGTASLKNLQAAINVPAGDMFAIRVAGHYYTRDGYFTGEGGKTTTKEGRIKALFQPNDALGIVLSVSAAETKTNGGGWQAFVKGKDAINYKGKYLAVTEGSPNKYRQVSLNLNYDFGGNTLTYIGGYHDYDSTGMGAETGKAPNFHRDLNEWPTDWYHSQEIRLASKDEGNFVWLVGANYFKHRFNTSTFSLQTAWQTDPDLPAGSALGLNAPIFGQVNDGYIENEGVFTENTYKVRDNFRITAGLRYDRTKMDQYEFFRSNTNMTAVRNVMNPATFVSTSIQDNRNYNNFTYKLRFEYDLSKRNMIYLLTATGFMPGFVAISPINSPMGTTFQIIDLDQQKLTSYELGAKNQFLNNTLRLNGDIYYYDYEGYVEAVSVSDSGPPRFVPFTVPLEMYGAEIEAEYLISSADRVSLNMGIQKIKITDFPMAGVYDSHKYMALEELPGNSPVKATLSYDHTFMFNNGSSLVPRAEVIYTGDYYLAQISQAQNTAEGATNTKYNVVGLGVSDYNYQSSYEIVNLGATWTSADGKYGATAYVRNALDKEYKDDVGLTTRTAKSEITVTPGDPRTFGINLSIKF